MLTLTQAEKYLINIDHQLIIITSTSKDGNLALHPSRNNHVCGRTRAKGRSFLHLLLDWINWQTPMIAPDNRKQPTITSGT